MDPKVFISYRRADSLDITARIYDHLEPLVGRGVIFRDVDDIPYGVPADQHLSRVLDGCHVVLVVIGPKWLCPRLQEPEDFVRMEIEQALRRKIDIIPIFVGGASMPTRPALPASIGDLTPWNGIRVTSDQSFNASIASLAQTIQRKLAAHREMQAGIHASLENAAQVRSADDTVAVSSWLDRIAFSQSTFARYAVGYVRLPIICHGS